MSNKVKKKLKTSDNVDIAINHLKNDKNEVVIIAPGWFMTKDSKAFSELAFELSQSYDVITMDFRGHGESGGFYTFTSKETKDLAAVVNWAKNAYEKVYLMGFSLGGGLVLIHGAIEKNVDKIIAVSAHCDFKKIENQMWRKEAWAQTFKKFELKRWLSTRPSIIIRRKISPVDIVEQVEVPTLFIAGEKDPTVHYWHTKTLYDKAQCKKHFELFENCCHAEDLFIAQKDKFLNLCKNWLSGA